MGNVGGPLSGRQRKSSAKKRTSATKKTRKGGQPGQGNQPQVVMSNNFFPALNEAQPNGGYTSEQITAMHQAMMQNQEGVEEQFQDDQNMQLIDEVPLEEEEGESQDVTQSKKIQGQPQQYVGYTQMPPDQQNNIPEEHYQDEDALNEEQQDDDEEN